MDMDIQQSNDVEQLRQWWDWAMDDKREAEGRAQDALSKGNRPAAEMWLQQAADSRQRAYDITYRINELGGE